MIPTPKPFGTLSTTGIGGMSIMNPTAINSGGSTTGHPPTHPPAASFPAPPTHAPHQQQQTTARMGRYVVDTNLVGVKTQAPSQPHPGRPPMDQQHNMAPPSTSSQPQVQHQQEQQPPPSQDAGDARPRTVSLSKPVSSTQLSVANPEHQSPDSFLCMSQGVVASNAELQKQSRLPFGAVCRPLCNDVPVPCVNMGPSGIIRCKACRAYINPFVEFFEGGRKWRCNLCYAPNDVTGAYFSPLENGVRTDLARHPELHAGVCDFIAPAEYMVRPPMAPAYLFVLDVSYYSIQSGLLASAVAGIRASLDYLPGKPRTRVGIITFDKCIHLYRQDKSSPSMLSVADVDDETLEPCVPDAVLGSFEECRATFEATLSIIETAYLNTTVQDSCGGPALRTALYIGRQWGCKVLYFTSSLSKLGAPGKWALAPREQEGAKLIGTDDESSLLKPISQAYKELAIEMSKAQIACDVFSFSPYADLATLGSLSKFSGGRLHYYGTEAIKAEEERTRLFYDVFYTLTAEQAWEGVMRLRCSKGVAVNGTNVFGNFHIRSTDLLALPCMDHTQAYTFQLKVEENLNHIRRISFQVALLYTTSNNERRIRVLNKCLPVSGSLADVFRTAHCETICDLICKMAIARAQEQRISVAREVILNGCVDILKTYKASFSAGANLLQELVIPESLYMMPYLVLGMLKNSVFRVALGERLDRRAFFWNNVASWPLVRTSQFLLPRAFAIRDEALQLSTPLKLSLQSVAEAGGVVVLDNTVEIIFYVARSVDVNILATLFAVTSFDEVPAQLPVVDSPISANVHESLRALRTSWGGWSRVSIVKEGDARSVEVLAWFLEDKLHSPPVPSLQDFIRQLVGLVSAALKK